MCWPVQFRALITGAVIGTIFSIIVHKLNLTTGIVPSLNIAAGLLGFIFLRSWTLLVKACGMTPHEFTPQASPHTPAALIFNGRAYQLRILHLVPSSCTSQLHAFSDLSWPFIGCSLHTLTHADA